MRVLATLLAIGLIGVGLWRGGWLGELEQRIPRHWLPWQPLTIDEPAGLFTRLKMARLGQDHELCQRILAAAGFRQTRVDDRVTGPGCGFTNAVTITRLADTELSAPFTLSCPAAVALAMWERQVLQPASRQYLGTAAARLEHFGSYACRNLYNRPSGRRSSHATADAIDIAGFVGSDGRRVRVLADWEQSGAEGEFLNALRDGACRFFPTVLGPEYNAAHRDHFHFEAGGFSVCR